MDSWLGTKPFSNIEVCYHTLADGSLARYGQQGAFANQFLYFLHEAFVRFSFNHTSKGNLHNRVGLAEPAEPNGFSIMMGPASPHGRCKRKPFIAWAIDLQNMQSCSPLRRNSLSSERVYSQIYTRSYCPYLSSFWSKNVQQFLTPL